MKCDGQCITDIPVEPLPERQVKYALRGNVLEPDVIRDVFRLAVKRCHMQYAHALGQLARAAQAEGQERWTISAPSNAFCSTAFVGLPNAHAMRAEYRIQRAEIRGRDDKLVGASLPITTMRTSWPLSLRQCAKRNAETDVPLFRLSY